VGRRDDLGLAGRVDGQRAGAGARTLNRVV
jgi:hypothetical protein